MDNMRFYWPGWETVRLIGRGSFGAVYEIQRDIFGDIEKAALKVISIPQNASDIEEMYSDGYDDESITSTFQSHLKSIVAEYSLMRKMNGCANVVNCDDVRYVQHDDGIGWDIFIKMELLTPLTKALPAEIPEETVIRTAKDICAALELCKKHEIVHRDIKPQNIFVSPNGDYKLGDFGIAKTVEKTMGGTKIGTYKYMAPEVYNNQPYGSSADIYSLGLVLYWMLNERRMPFLPLPPAKLGAGMDEAARNRRLSGEPIPAPAHGGEELKRIVLKACAFDPKERYQSAREMLQELKALENGTVSNVVHEKESQKAETVPADTYEAAEEPDNGTMTVGPVWGKAPVDSSDATEGTVGPVFTPRGGQEHAPRAEQERLRREKEEQCETDQLPDQSVSKKKKTSWLWAAVAALVVIVIGFMTIHISTAATCAQAPVCKICGKVTGQALGHNWMAATCVSPRTCASCGTTEGPALGHNWIAATCVSPRLCAYCSATEGSALGHNWKEATCASPRTCVTCGTAEGAALAHHWANATYERPATCEMCGKTRGDVKGYIGSVGSSYSQYGVALGYHSGIPCLVLDSPIINCRRFTFELFLGEADDGTPLGNWEVYVKTTDGAWKSIGIIDVQTFNSSNEFFFATPISFTAIAATRLSTSPATHTMGYDITNVQVYTD